MYLFREKPRIPDTPEKRGDLLYPMKNRLTNRPDRREKAEQDLIHLADKVGWTKPDQVQEVNKARVDKVEKVPLKIPNKVAQRRYRTKQDQVQELEKAKGDQEENVSSKPALAKDRVRSDKVQGVEKARPWNRTEQEEAPSQVDKIFHNLYLFHI